MKKLIIKHFKLQVLTEDSKMEGNGGSDHQKVLNSGNTQISHKTKSVGQSKFYDVASSTVTPEKQDIMKPDDYNDDIIGKTIFQFYI